jgi:hypothetical protein
VVSRASLRLCVFSYGLLVSLLLGLVPVAFADEPSPAAPAAPASGTSPETPVAVEPPEPPPAGFLPSGEPIPPPPPPLPVVPLEGRVVEKGSRDPLSGVRVKLLPLPPMAPVEPQEVVTDKDGRFTLPEVVPGTYLIKMQGPLIRLSESRERISPGRKKSVTYYVPRREGQFELVVRADPVRREVTETVLDVNELKRIPGTQNDPIKAVQNLPGVARSPFGGGLLVVWGSAPGDTRVYANGVTIPRIFHFGGLRATLNAEFVSELSFKPGAYGADFGRGLGGVIDVTTRAPKSDRFHGSVTLDLIDGSLTVEGPITKKLHVAAGARVSWISVFIPIFNRSNFQISPFYWDYQVALRYQPTVRDDIDTLIFGSTDNISARVENPDPATNVSIDTKSYFGRALVRWTHRFSRDTSLFVMPSIGGDTMRFDTGESGVGGIQLKLDSLTLQYNLRAEVRHRATSWLQLFGGLDFEGRRSSFDVLAPVVGAGGGGGGAGPPGQSSGAALSLISSSRDQSVLHLLRTAPYLIARAEFFERRLIVSPQLRLDTNYIRSYDGEVSRSLIAVEPRMFISLQAIPRYLLLKFGIGRFSQIPQPQQLSQVFGNSQLLLEYGTTYVAGFEVDPTSTLSIQSQFFYKDLRTLVAADSTTRFDNDGLGRVIGGDFLLRQRLWRGLFGWIAYTVSRSERKDNPETPWHLFAFDQTHILTLIASYKLPWQRVGLEVGLRFRYVTGNPRTPTIGGVRNTVGQTWTPLSGDLYSDRLPDFHQLDLRIDKTWTFNRWKLGLYLDIQNLYNRSNTETLVYGGRQLSQVSPISGIPFFPNLGLRADF